MPSSPQGAASPALALFGVRGVDGEEDLAIRTPVATIGQGTQNDLVLADDSVSRVHARLAFEAGEWRLTDLGSVNGTAVDGTRLAPETPVTLPDGAEVRFGGVVTRFRTVEAADPAAARARFTPPEPEIRVAERRGFRFPLWALVVALLLIALAVYFFFQYSAPPGPVTTWLPAPLPAPPGSA